MLGRYKATFIRLSSSLDLLKKDPGNLEQLWILQREIIKSVRRCEMRIGQLRRRLDLFRPELRNGRSGKTESTKLKRKIEVCEENIASYRQVIYFVKCFGDGIAFLYLDGFALKHTYYKTADYTVREEPGFLTANRGFALECKVAKMALRHEMPALLCDLTNVIRYGDVCLLAGPDPFFIEVKSSENENKRTVRQRKNLNELANFYLNDGAEEFRGKSNIVRQAMSSNPVTHHEFMNALIDRALTSGFEFDSPEHGIVYGAIKVGATTAKDWGAAFEEHLVRPHLAFLLNEAKNSTSWLPLHPFTLSLSRDHVASFIVGDIFLVVLVDIGAMKWCFDELGASAVMLDDENYALQIICKKNDPNQGIFRVSRQMVSRLALEFWSLQWFAKEQVALPESAISSSQTAQPGTWQIPQAWLGLDDGIPISRPDKFGGKTK